MTRKERLQQSFNRDMKLIEIGASYNPIIPKAEGWNTTVIDHATQAELRIKYEDGPFPVSNIEYVDFVWRTGPLLEAVPAHLHGTFDGLIASHVGEHMPDLIGFFNAVATLLKPTGFIVFALPDKRLCFDYFQSVTTTGMLLDAKGRTRHPTGVRYDHAAYMAARGGNSVWGKGGPVVPFDLAHKFDAVRTALVPTDDYVDAHAWHFTPGSFRLLIYELTLLGEIPWGVNEMVSEDATEFHVTLTRQSALADDSYRLTLLTGTVLEMKEEIAALEGSPEPEPEDTAPTISAIIPLYNGGRFIEESLRSILNQTVKPIEIIVVDDGSTDDGPDKVKAMAKHHPITLLRKPNGGQSSARNFGVAHSTGDLIALLDQDDAWYPPHQEILRKPFMDTHIGAELGWTYSNLDEVDTDGMMIAHKFLTTLGTPHPKRDLFECLREDMFILPSASLISRKAFDAVGGFDERLSGYEDDDLFLRLFRHGYNNIFINEALSRWRIYPESSSYSPRMRRSRAIYCRKLLDTYPDDPNRARFIKRDLLLPRFYVHAVSEWRKALESRDPTRIEETRAEVVFLTQLMSGKRRYTGAMIDQIKSPQTAIFLHRFRGVMKPLLRRAF